MPQAKHFVLFREKLEALAYEKMRRKESIER